MEKRVSVNGVIKNPYLSSYLIPTVVDVPTEVKSVILEYADPIGPFGARGMAEMPFLPFAPAIAAAGYAPTCAWLDRPALSPDPRGTPLICRGPPPKAHLCCALAELPGGGAP